MRDDNKRPDGSSLLPWAKRKPMAWDVTVPDTYAVSYWQHIQQARCSSPEGSTEQKWQVHQVKQYPHLLPVYHWNSWYMAGHGHRIDTRDWQAYLSCDRGQQGNDIPVPTPVHSSPKGGMRSPSRTQWTPHETSLQPFTLFSFNFLACGFVLVG